ncbi:hypothetical protein C3B79_2479 [Aeromonas hydrophila]|nr:hypothetical protein C3B79_2479 [Aeromonas hydrophila]
MAKGDAAAAIPLIESGNQGIIMAPFPPFLIMHIYSQGISYP